MKLTISITAGVSAFFLPVQGILIAVFIAVLADTATGIYKAKKLAKPIISKRMSDIIAKLIIYEVVVLLLFLIDHFLLQEFMKIWFSVDYFFTKLIALVVVAIELTSMKENIEEATGLDILKWLRSTLQRTKEIKNDVNDIIP